MYALPFMVCSFVGASTQQTSFTVYIVRNDDTDRTIHRVFLTERAAMHYVVAYKDSHNYEYEPLVLKE